MKNLRYYIRTYDNQDLSMIDLKKADLNARQMVFIPLAKTQSARDLYPVSRNAARRRRHVGVSLPPMRLRYQENFFRRARGAVKSWRLDACRADHFPPFLGFAPDDPAVFVGRYRRSHAAHGGELSLIFGSFKPSFRAALSVAMISRRRRPRRADAVPQARLIARLCTSAIAGMSGNIAARCAMVVTASARSLPERMNSPDPASVPEH